MALFVLKHLCKSVGLNMVGAGVSNLRSTYVVFCRGGIDINEVDKWSRFNHNLKKILPLIKDYKIITVMSNNKLAGTTKYI